MPIYEFYCNRCNTIYNFFSRTINTEKVPFCPRCKDVQLKRKVSIFSAITGRSADQEEHEDGMPPIDESKMAGAMEMLAREAGSMDEEDPRQAARLMRRLSDATGLKMGDGMEEALSRLERGEDPDRIESEMGDLLDGEEPFVLEAKSKGGSRKDRPKVDETLYEL